MKTLLTAIILTAFTTLTYAQTLDDYLEIARDVLNTEKKAAVAEAMQLSEEVSAPFWELYNEYQLNLGKVQNERIALIKDFAKNYESLTDEKADELWNGILSYQQDLLKLKKSYYKKFKKIIPSGQAAKYFQIENKIEALINAELAAQIPLMETE
jgi:vacuolar-type H+-ATPase subunit D/Vma8